MNPEAYSRYADGLPLARRWKPRTYGQDVKFLRQQLDDLLHPQQVCWDPYADSRSHHPLHPITFFTVCLKYGDIVEPYHPERVLRQWGYLQTIPPPPLAPYRAKRGSSSTTYQVAYTFVDSLWDRWEMYVLPEEKRGRKWVTVGETAPGYMAWFDSISHRYIQNRAHATSFHVRAFDHFVMLRVSY